MASAQSSPYTANQLKSRCRPNASTTISTNASPIERQRIERIGGDRICESALTAASSMAALSFPKPSRELEMLVGFGKGKARHRLRRGFQISFRAPDALLRCLTRSWSSRYYVCRSRSKAYFALQSDIEGTPGDT